MLNSEIGNITIIFKNSIKLTKFLQIFNDFEILKRIYVLTKL